MISVKKIYLSFLVCICAFSAAAQQISLADTIKANQLASDLIISRPKAARLFVIMRSKQKQIDSVYKSPNIVFSEKRLLVSRIIRERDSLVNSLLDPRELQRLAAAIEKQYGDKRNQYRLKLEDRKRNEGAKTDNQ